MGTSSNTFVRHHTGKAHEIEGVSDSSAQEVNSNVIQNPLTNAQNQQWVLEDLGNGYLQIRACGKSLVLDVVGARSDVGTNIQAYKANQTDAQMWTLVKAYGKVAAEARLVDAELTKGYYRIVPADIAGLSVDIASNSKTNGANIRLYNTLINAAKSDPGDEHLIDYTESYPYLLDIDYDPECIPHLCSAIFLHCSRNQPTAGCVAISREEMMRVLRMIAVGTKISIE